MAEYRKAQLKLITKMLYSAIDKEYRHTIHKNVMESVKFNVDARKNYRQKLKAEAQHKRIARVAAITLTSDISVLKVEVSTFYDGFFGVFTYRFTTLAGIVYCKSGYSISNKKGIYERQIQK